MIFFSIDSEKNPAEDDGEPEKREDHEADFIPMPGKDIVPGKNKQNLIYYLNC